jgi:hypothetical protein
MSASQMMSRVGFDSNSTLFAAAEHFMSAFACDVVKIVSVVDEDARDVALHMTVSRGAHPLSCCFERPHEFLSGVLPSTRRQVIRTHAHVPLSSFICPPINHLCAAITLNKPMQAADSNCFNRFSL